MQRVLIPTDFSDNSWNAIKYGLELFKNIKCTFYLLHVNPIPPYSGAGSSVRTTTVVIKDAMIKESKVELKKLQEQIKDISDNPNHTFINMALYDYFVDSVKREVQDKKIDLIIMGTKGASGLKKVTVGSNTGDVITKVKCPLLAVPENATYKIAALDIGIKKNILRNLAKRDAYIKVFPYNSTFDEMNAWEPDGFFISNGPGDPEPLEDAIEAAKKIINSDKPLFGICLGHQVVALANNVSTYKMYNGHRGINHPVINKASGKGEITSQNHGFAINREETENHDGLIITHIHLNDDTVAGIRMKDKMVFSVQYHPEASPGPHDSDYLFDEFFELIRSSVKKNQLV